MFSFTKDQSDSMNRQGKKLKFFLHRQARFQGISERKMNLIRVLQVGNGEEGITCKGSLVIMTEQIENFPVLPCGVLILKLLS